jgi:hypothetical protein
MLYHMQIDKLLPFRTICRSTHHDHFVPYAKSYADSTFILILHHIQINVIHKYSTKMILTMVRNGRYEMVMVRNDYNSRKLPLP